jgi:hypothetical protein
MNLSETESPYNEFSSNPTSASEQSVAISVPSATTSIIASFQTPTGVPNTTNIIGGVWSFFVHFVGVTGDDWEIYVEVFSRTNVGVETLLLTTNTLVTNSLSAIPTMLLLDGFLNILVY